MGEAEAENAYNNEGHCAMIAGCQRRIRAPGTHQRIQKAVMSAEQYAHAAQGALDMDERKNTRRQRDRPNSGRKAGLEVACALLDRRNEAATSEEQGGVILCYVSQFRAERIAPTLAGARQREHRQTVQPKSEATHHAGARLGPPDGVATASRLASAKMVPARVRR